MTDSVEPKVSKPRRRRDPEARRREIIEATVSLIYEVGVQEISHRAIAERARVPLGSTTQHFASLDELLEAGFRVIVDEWEEDIAAWERRLQKTDTLAEDIADGFIEYLSDSHELMADTSLRVLALRQQQFTELFERWKRQFESVLAGVTDIDAAARLSVLYSGYGWHTSLYHVVPNKLDVTEAVRRLL